MPRQYTGNASETLILQGILGRGRDFYTEFTQFEGIHSYYKSGSSASERTSKIYIIFVQNFLKCSILELKIDLANREAPQCAQEPNYK